MYIFQRSLVYARRESPALESVTVDADGSVQGLDNLWLSASAIDRSAALETEVTVVAHLLSLLTSIIGTPLTLRMIKVTWREISLDANHSLWRNPPE